MVAETVGFLTVYGRFLLAPAPTFGCGWRGQIRGAAHVRLKERAGGVDAVAIENLGERVSPGMPVLSSGMDFDQASAAVVEYLKQAIPMDNWSVSRYDGDSQVFLTVRDDSYGIGPGTAVPWSNTMCQYAMVGAGPDIAPDCQSVPAYAAVALDLGFDIGTYVGFPIRTADGKLFGSLCGIDPASRSPELVAHRPLLDLLSMLLGTVLQADLTRAEQTRQLQRVAVMAESDPLTGMVNRRGWARFAAMEEERYRRFGDPGCVIVIDLDGLKSVNDTAGHSEGDRYLQQAAAAMSATVRQSDLVARLGGDEFGVLAARSTEDEAAVLVTRLRRTLEAAGTPASVGHAAYTFAAGITGAWEAADRAMYEDKRRRAGPSRQSSPG